MLIFVISSSLVYQILQHYTRGVSECVREPDWVLPSQHVCKALIGEYRLLAHPRSLGSDVGWNSIPRRPPWRHHIFSGVTVVFTEHFSLIRYLIWIGSDQEKTFGPTISGLIHRHLEPERVCLWDSKARGKSLFSHDAGDISYSLVIGECVR